VLRIGIRSSPLNDINELEGIRSNPTAELMNS